jgi:glycosyltransferase involved in cell wall biosynthesis
LVIGTGPQEAALKKRAEILQLQDSVQFIGSVYDAHTLGKYLLSSSIYVLAGMGGLSINDAMCFGLPVICSVCDGTETRLVKEGYNGLYFEEGNEKDLAEKIIYLLNNPQMVKKKGGHSTDIIKNEINIHTVINGYLNAFNYVMQNQL